MPSVKTFAANNDSSVGPPRARDARSRQTPHRPGRARRPLERQRCLRRLINRKTSCRSVAVPVVSTSTTCRSNSSSGRWMKSRRDDSTVGATARSRSRRRTARALRGWRADRAERASRAARRGQRCGVAAIARSPDRSPARRARRRADAPRGRRRRCRSPPRATSPQHAVAEGARRRDEPGAAITSAALNSAIGGLGVGGSSEDVPNLVRARH